MSDIQDSRRKLDHFYKEKDPWGYDEHPDDLMRKQLILREMSRFAFGTLLDIGCGNGFITGSISADQIVGVDISEEAICAARNRVSNDSCDFRRSSIEELPLLQLAPFDAVLITGVLYPHYIGNSLLLVYRIVDDLLKPGGVLFSVHIEEWYNARFPFLLVRRRRYRYREFHHVMETYLK